VIAAGELVIAADATEVAELAAQRMLRELEHALASSERVSLALSGGTTPGPAYARLAELSRASLDWQRVDLYFADERMVPETDSHSNLGLVRAQLLTRLGTRQPRLVPLGREQADGERTAADYERELPARLDLVVLGVGEDGHTAALFPGSQALAESERRVLHVIGPKPPPRRLTLAPRALAEARRLLVLAIGESKAHAVGEALQGQASPRQCPARLARGGTWIIDRSAAVRLDPPSRTTPRATIERKR
jgi:6-phosphogluconolactonase